MASTILALLVCLCTAPTSVEAWSLSDLTKTKDDATDAKDTANGIACGAGVLGKYTDCPEETTGDAEGAVSDAGDSVEGAAGDAADTLSDAKDGATGAVSDAGDSVEGAAGDAADTLTDAKDGATGALSDAGDSVTGAAGDAADGATGALSDAGDSVTGSLSDAKDGASGALSDAGNSVTGAAGDARSKLGSAVSDTKANTKSWFDEHRTGVIIGIALLVALCILIPLCIYFGCFHKKKTRAAGLSYSSDEESDGPRMMEVRLPQGAAAGAIISVRTPTGESRNVQTPYAIPPGGAFNTAY